MLQTVAVMGPLRFAVPLTQALSAPLIGRLVALGTPVFRQILACAVIRVVHNTLTVAFFALVLAGGIDAYTDTYDSFASRLPLLPEGTRAALLMTAVAILAWTVFASVVQVVVYRRGLRRWQGGEESDGPGAEAEPGEYTGERFDPRAVAIAAAIAFGLLLASTAWPLLAAVAAWLVLASVASGGDRDVIPAGAALTLILAVGVFGFTLAGGIGLESALQRGARAGLLVAVATWLRAAAGSAGLREISQRVLGRLRRLPSASEAMRILDELGSGRQLNSAARSVLDTLRSVPARPVPILDAVLGWVVAESRRFLRAPRERPARLSAGLRDAVLLALAAAPAIVLAV